MQITVILTPDAVDESRLLSRQAWASINEALKLRRSGQADQVRIVVIGQSLDESQGRILQRQSVDCRVVRDVDINLGPMELVELFIDVIRVDHPDLIFIARREEGSSCSLGNLLAELLHLRQPEALHSDHERTLVIREIGSGMHRVRVA